MVNSCTKEKDHLGKVGLAMTIASIAFIVALLLSVFKFVDSGVPLITYMVFILVWLLEDRAKDKYIKCLESRPQDDQEDVQ